MKKLFYLLPFLVVGLAACDNNTNNDDSADVNDTTILNTNVDHTNSSAVEDETAEFMKKTASDGKLEVALGNLAQMKSSNVGIKEFGQMLVKDHSEAGKKLADIAKNKNVVLRDTLLEDHQDDYDKLKDLSGTDFDKKFISMQVDMHKDDIDKFTDKAEDIKDTDVMRWITETVPVLKKHLEKAEALKDQIK